MADEEGNPLQETFVLLDDELVDYFAGLEGFPVFRGLQGLDPVEETWIDAEVREMLEREVAELAARARRREVPEPPEWVGLEGTGDIRLGEELGWNGPARAPPEARAPPPSRPRSWGWSSGRSPTTSAGSPSRLTRRGFGPMSARLRAGDDLASAEKAALRPDEAGLAPDKASLRPREAALSPA